VGSITNDEARRVTLRLDFLPPGQRFEATIYADDPAAPTATHVGIRQRTVDARTVLELDLPASGGQALWLRPVAAR
jgi:alpha-glucosidase